VDNEISLKQALVNAFRRQCQERPGTLLGIACGVTIAIGILLFGFWSVLFVAVCGFIGCFIGKNVDKGGSFIDNIRDSVPRDIHRWR